MDCAALGYTAAEFSAINYYPLANTDDASCFFAGCTDSTRPNYDIVANVDDGLCMPLFPGCMEPSGLNYKNVYTVDDGSCSFQGCNDPTKTNYNPAATFNDGTCTGRRQLGMLNAIAASVTSPRRRLSEGCMDPQASNYDDAATSHNQDSCTYHVLGCMDTLATNYLPSAQMERSPSDCISDTRLHH